MLVLTRKRDELIMIGDEIEITVVNIGSDKVRLGINAPKSVPVHRREVYEAVKRERETTGMRSENSPGEDEADPDTGKP